MVSREEIVELLDLSMLNMEEGEIDSLVEDLAKLKVLTEDIFEVDIEGLEPRNFINDRQQVLREDQVKDSIDKEEALKNAPDEQYGYFKLINVMED